MERLLKYIGQFQTMQEVQWGGGKMEDGTVQFPFPVYPVFVREFEEELYSLEASNGHYGDVLTENGWWEQAKMLQDIPAMGAEEVIACLTAIYRSERFCDGSILSFIKSGAIVQLLCRLKELL